MIVKAELSGQDYIEMDTEDSKHLKVIGCHPVLSLVRDYKRNHGEDVSQWPIPREINHESLLLKEALLRQKNKWNYTYNDIELCHCRSVMAVVVDSAIMNGAHTPEKVSRATSASTGCGTCRSDVQNLIKYRLGS